MASYLFNCAVMSIIFVGGTFLTWGAFNLITGRS